MTEKEKFIKWLNEKTQYTQNKLNENMWIQRHAWADENDVIIVYDDCVYFTWVEISSDHRLYNSSFYSFKDFIKKYELT